MTKSVRWILITMMCLGKMISANAQLTASATATVSANIVSPVGATKMEDMSFSRFSIATGKPTEISQNVEPALFNIIGDPGSYSISLQTDPIEIKRKDGKETIKINSFTILPLLQNKAKAGTRTLAIGATLNLSKTQAEGTYVSLTPYTVTVDFN